MDHKDFYTLKSFKIHNGQVLIPAQIETQEWLETLPTNKEVLLKEVAIRDLGMHKAYFLILKFIYNRLNKNFRDKVQSKDFYMWLKFVSKDFVVKFKFKDGREFIEYNSISFAKNRNFSGT